MHLYEIPMIFILVGLTLYVVLGGADFGAGLWQLGAIFEGGGGRSSRIRAHAHNSMAPVWEANHVWLIFVLTVTWTAYPVAFGSIASTLAIPLFLAGVGIIFRGAAYVLRSGDPSPKQLRLIDTIFALSSGLAPFALGTMIGGIASRRVPVGNASGNELSSWLNPTSLLIGVLVLVSCGYLAAVYLAADAARKDERALEQAFRMRALLSGAVAGGLAIAGLFVLHSDARALYEHLLGGDGLVGLVLSAAAGVSALGLVWMSRFEQARYTAALAVAAIIAGWALAQQPILLPGLTIKQAAAPHDTLVVVIVAVLAGALILFPSLAFLFRLLLSGGLDEGSGEGAPPDGAEGASSVLQKGTPRTPSLGDVHPPSPGALLAASRDGLLGRLALASLIGGFGFLTAAEAGWAHAIGVLCLFGFMVLGFFAYAPAQVVLEGLEPHDERLGSQDSRGVSDHSSS